MSSADRPLSAPAGQAPQPQLPLVGAVIALPAARESDALAGLLAEAGASLHRFEPEAPSNERAIERWLSRLVEGEFDDVVVFSAQGVRLVCEIARQLDREAAVLQALSGVRLIAYSGRAARALAEFGLRAAIRLGQEGLPSGLDTLEFKERVVALQPRDPGECSDLIRYLEGRGAKVHVAGRSIEPATSARLLLTEICEGDFDGLVFFGPSQVAWLWDAALAVGSTGALCDALRKCTVVASDAAAEALRDRGVQAARASSRVLRGRATTDDLRSLFRLSVKAGPTSDRTLDKKRLVVVGHGMVAHELCERLAALDVEGSYVVTVLGEEPIPAYDRVKLTSYFETRDPRSLILADRGAYAERGTRLRLSTSVARIDPERRLVLTASGEPIPYDTLVLATGSAPFVPPVPGMEKPGVFVYRTIADLDAMIEYARGARSAAVIGGGLLGLEAAKAVRDLGLETHVVEFAPRLMPRQLDAAGGDVLLRKVTDLGVVVHLGKTTARVHGEEKAAGLRFADGARLDVDMIVVSAGIRPRDELAREAGLAVGERGGIVVDDHLRTSDPNVYAIGECALHRGAVYGLVAPGWEMARTLAARLTGADKAFSGADMSTKLKLLGVDVASVGDPFADARTGRAIVFSDLVHGVYKKMVLSNDGTRVIGAVLVGDATQYSALLHASKCTDPLPESPEDLLLGSRGGPTTTGTALPGTAQVCSCNGVTKDDLCGAIREKSLSTLAEVKKCTRATTGCGGCAPLVTDILQAELLAAGKAVRPRLCEHFSVTRAELFEIVRVKGLTSFAEVLAQHGTGHGCEVCKPTVASILASVHNAPILDHDTIQDTNDRFLANIQRGGLYSVVPRIPGGEITPEKLITIGEVARKFNLYTKITGGQRIDLLGARVNDLPEIWEALVNAGFESGHAYGKSMRTVKSCVGSTWCRYGVQDSVSFAIRVEERYKGIRSPHKLKSAVSGCVRECAEAQCKDFGLIATEKGWNVYVCGNGGAKPRHADLLASDVDDDTAIRYLDRFIMFYIRTADRLTRTSVWLEKLEGGLAHLKDVIIHDKLGLCATLEADMQRLVDTFECEWTAVVKDPVRRAKFKHFAGSNDADATVAWVTERDQDRPRDWDTTCTPRPAAARREGPRSWVRVGHESDFPKEGGIAIRHGDLQVAVFNFTSRGQWYAVENRCPHRGDEVLARGIIGDEGGTPKVACPLHKKTFALDDGHCLSGDAPAVEAFPVHVSEGWVLVELPPAVTDGIVPTHQLVRRSRDAVSAAE